MTTITMLATLPAVLAIVNLLKGVGLAGKWSAVVAVAIGVALSVADYALAGSGMYQAAASGLILGLGAAGVYDVTRPAKTATWESLYVAGVSDATTDVSLETIGESLEPVSRK